MSPPNASPARPPRLEAAPPKPEAPRVEAPAAHAPLSEEHTQPEMKLVEISAELIAPLPGDGEDEAKSVWARFADAEDKFAAGPDTITALEAVIARHPHCAGAHYFCGQVYLFVGDEVNARVWFEKTLAVDSNHGPAQQRLAMMRS